MRKLFIYLALSLTLILFAACQAAAPVSQPAATANEIQPTKVQPTEVQPTKAQPTEAQPVEAQSNEVQPAEAQSNEVQPVETQPAEAQPSDTDRDDREIFRSGLINAEQETLDGLPGASVYHIAFQIADDLTALTGHQEVHYTNREDEALNEIYFRTFPNVTGGALRVSEVKVDGETVEPAYEFEDSAIRVPLPTPLQPGDQIDIQMDFEVEVALDMAGNYGLFGYFDDVLVLDEFYPVIPAFDDEGWNVETPPPNADTSHFDASFYLARVTAPASLKIAASGLEVERQTEDGKQLITFAAGPVRDFYLAASDKYTVISDTVGETTINVYTFADQTTGAETALEISVNSLKSFNRRFGAYPYTEYDVLSTPMQALGIEYPGIVGVALPLFDPKETVAGLPFPVMLEGAVAHEAGHQWFYNVVGNDQVDEPWVDEAVVQYITGLYYADTYGEQVAQQYRASWDSRWERVNRADIPIGLPAGDYEGREYSAIVYGRGPLFIAALAEKMGQDIFDDFLRNYYQSHKWGIGTGEAFKQLAEKHCQCDLTPLFKEWVYEK